MEKREAAFEWWKNKSNLERGYLVSKHNLKRPITNEEIGEIYLLETHIPETTNESRGNMAASETEKETVNLIGKLSEDEKKEALQDFVQQSAKYTLAMFKACGLETHIECMIIDDDSKKHYIYRFQEEEYFKAQRINQPTTPTLLNELREKLKSEKIPNDCEMAFGFNTGISKALKVLDAIIQSNDKP